MLCLLSVLRKEIHTAEGRESEREVSELMTCPKCGQPRELDVADQIQFACQTWMLGPDVMQSGECSIRVVANGLREQLAAATSKLEAIEKLTWQGASTWKDVLEIIHPRSNP